MAFHEKFGYYRMLYKETLRVSTINFHINKRNAKFRQRNQNTYHNNQEECQTIKPIQINFSNAGKL